MNALEQIDAAIDSFTSDLDSLHNAVLSIFKAARASGWDGSESIADWIVRTRGDGPDKEAA